MTEKKVCPVCGESGLFYEAGGYVGAVYHCKNCGYVGSLIIEGDDEMIEEIKKRYREPK